MSCGNFQIQHALVPHPKGKRLTCLDYPYLQAGTPMCCSAGGVHWCPMYAFLRVLQPRMCTFQDMFDAHERQESRGGAAEDVHQMCMYLAEYLVFHMTCILLHNLPVIYADGVNTHPDCFRDIGYSTCSDSDAGCNVEAASQGSWDLKVLPS